MILVATPALTATLSPPGGAGGGDGVLDDGADTGQPGGDRGLQPTLARHPNWRYQFQLCGVAGLVVWVIVLIGLRSCRRGCAIS